MNVSAIIPALNEAERIAASVRRAWEAGADEVWVVDGGSSDGTANAAATAGAHVLPSPRGRALQQNIGADHATGGVLLFLHADNWLAAGATDEIRRTLADPRILHGAFRQRIDHDGPLYRALERGNAARVRWFGIPYGDQALFVRRDAFDECGRFPEWPLMEDVALARQLRHRAWPALLAGPLHVDPRRWQRHGVIRQTARNWGLLAGYFAGISPTRLARFYRRHDV